MEKRLVFSEMKRIDFVFLSVNLVSKSKKLEPSPLWNRGKKTKQNFFGGMPKAGNPRRSALWDVKCFSNFVLTLRLTCCVSLGKLLPLSGPVFPHL